MYFNLNFNYQIKIKLTNNKYLNIFTFPKRIFFYLKDYV